ncbi:junctional adhesion molecule 2A-like isoform X1 [Acipenser ruthenus]|uniref:junctional adhesion molecule 2A-like isoform X1 n=1 Tax=Acipenser ruthenus TaxID=7906 RepID=UPI00145A94E5|nr:junctional adhesion molecule 2A-like isoform X1 [Acipenser ruthenus]
MAALHLGFLLVFLILQHIPRGFLVTVQTENGKVEVEEFGETVLSCKYQVEKDPNPRVEWKKIRNRDVSFVYYEGKIVGGFQGRAVMEGASIRIKKAMLLDSGEYRCEVSARQDSRPLGEATVSLTVLVPPDVPSCGIPSSVLTGTVVELTCRDRQGTPPSLYRWYKDGVALPTTPAQDPLFANSSYTLNSSSGTLQFNTVSKGDAGQYQCEASNGVGEPQRCAAKFMQIDDMNVSGIVAAVVVVSLVVSMCGLGVFFAHRQGYFNRGHGRSFWIPQYEDIVQISNQNLKTVETNGSSEYCTAPQDYSQDFKHTQSFML